MLFSSTFIYIILFYIVLLVLSILSFYLHFLLTFVLLNLNELFSNVLQGKAKKTFFHPKKLRKLLKKCEIKEMFLIAINF